MQYQSFLLILALSFFSHSCIEELEVFADNERHLVIDGEFSNEKKPQKVRIYYATGFNKISDFITNAEVSIHSVNGDYIPLFYDAYGYYSTSPESFAIEGEAYFLQVILPNEEIYRSDTIYLPRAIEPLDAVYHQKAKNGKSVILTADFQDPPGQENYYKFKWTGTYQTLAAITQLDCFVPSTSIEQIFISSDLFYDGEKVSRIEVGREVFNNKFNYGYLFRVQAQHITKDAFNYWSALKNQLENTGTIFETQNYRIKGNISNVTNEEELVLGYFNVSYITPPTRLIIYDYINTFPPQSCEPDPFSRRISERCLSCSAYNPFATSNRPEDWR